MGVLVDANPNTAAVDSWALVSGTTVSNIISANHSFIVSIQGSYDYLVDIDYGAQSPAPSAGWSYNPGNDSFSAPPIDYSAILEADIYAIQSYYIQALNDYAAAVADSQQSAADAGISNGLSDASGTYSANEAAPFAALVALVSTGG